MGLTYKDSGVDTEAGISFVKKITPIVKSTFSKNVITDIGGFGALFSGTFKEIDDPVLVSGTDGVGTKLKIAQMMNVHNTIGIDAVAMCVNDIITSGAKPLFFLDYISCGKVKEDVLVDIVTGLADGCKKSECSLIGGETAEHPDIMPEDEYDIAGFSVGVVNRKNIINGKNIKAGDVIIGLPSSGVHSNGFSLVRKLFFEIKKFNVNTKLSDLPDNLGNVLLTPTTIYVDSIMKCLESKIDIKGIVHITGGGFYENIPRILPEGLAVKIDSKSYQIPKIFDVIKKEGNIEKTEMYSTFNMGIGMILIVDKNIADKSLDLLQKTGSNASIIGEVTTLCASNVVIE